MNSHTLLLAKISPSLKPRPLGRTREICLEQTLEAAALCSPSRKEPSCTAGLQPLLLQQGLYEPSQSLVGKFQSRCPLIRTRTMAAGSEHGANRALSVQQLKVGTLLQSLRGLEPWRRCLPKLSVLPHKAGIDFCRPDPRLVQSSGLCSTHGDEQGFPLEPVHLSVCPWGAGGSAVRLSTALHVKLPRVTFSLLLRCL